MSARERILGRLLAASFPVQQSSPDVAAWYASRQGTENPSQRIDRLRRALEAAHVEVHDSTADDWPRLLLSLAADKGVRTLLIGTGTPHAAVLEKLCPEQPQLIRYDDVSERLTEVLFDGTDASLTLAKSAIAETGSLILWPDASEPRLMSLAPAIHFVLLDAANIHADFHSAMIEEGWSNSIPSNALLISSPSKTSDIQQTLAYGAHGPLEVIVLLLRDGVRAA